MSTFVDEIVSMFTSSPLDVTSKEREQILTVEFSFDQGTSEKPPEEFPSELLSSRDAITIRWKNLDDDDYDNTDFLSTRDNWNDFLSGYSITDYENISIKVEVSKNVVDHKISVYDYEAFTEYIVALKPKDFIQIIDTQVRRGCTTIEVQEDTLDSWCTDVLSIVHKEEEKAIPQRVKKWAKRIELWKHSCRSNIQGIQLLPDDFYIEEFNSQDRLEKKFHEICILLSLSYIANDSIFEDASFQVHLSGYSVIDETINANSINIDYDNWNMFRIYQWIYDNDQIYDKLNIARNILSLNAQANLLNLPDDVLGIMVNNHNIFVKENVDRFIRVRNDISNFLLSYRSKADETIDKYVDSMAHNILVIASFILTTIIIKAISKAGFDNFEFPNSILWIILAMILVSGVQLYLNYKMITEKEPQYDKILESTRKQYEDILSDSELSILKGADNFWNKKKCFVTAVWIITLLILLIVDISFLLGWIR